MALTKPPSHQDLLRAAGFIAYRASGSRAKISVCAGSWHKASRYDAVWETGKGLAAAGKGSGSCARGQTQDLKVSLGLPENSLLASTADHFGRSALAKCTD